SGPPADRDYRWISQCLHDIFLTQGIEEAEECGWPGYRGKVGRVAPVPLQQAGTDTGSHEVAGIDRGKIESQIAHLGSIQFQHLGWNKDLFAVMRGLSYRRIGLSILCGRRMGSVC